MEIGPEKTKVMTNNPNGFQREIKIKGQRLEKWRTSSALGQSFQTKDQKPRLDSFQDSPDNSSSFKTEDHMEEQEYLACF